MKPQGLKLDEFIGMPNKIFAIPIFQRNYAWKPEHCKVFLDDILRLATTKNMAGEHYLGTICYKPHFKNNNTIECLIIDGQQRITTSMLLLRAIANHKNIDNKLKELIENNYINDSRDSKLRLKPMAKDENAFKEIMENSISDTTKGTRLFEAYEYFRENLKDTNKEDLMCIFNSLNRIQVIALELEEHDKAEIIFESINATGEKLHNCDLVRNYLMIDKDYDTQKRLFNEYWRHIEDLLGSEEELEQFVGHFLRISYENKITKDNIYAYFKKYKEEKGDSLPALEEMLYYAKIYALFVEKYHILEEYKPKEKKEIQKKIKTIVILKSGISYPFIMQIFNDFLQDNLDFSQLISILDIICSYIIRGQICSNIKNGNKIMYSLYSQMKEYMQQGDYVVALQKCLARDTAYFSNDKDFKECFVEYNFYNNRIRSLAKLILLEIEHSTNKENLKDEDLTIEHIYPKNPGKYAGEWKKMAGESWEDLEYYYVNTIGNLTLSGINSKLSNKPFWNKKQDMEKFANLHLNRYFKDIDKWNIEEIEKRAKKLFSKIKKIFKDLPEEIREEIREENKKNILYDLYDYDFDPTNLKPIMLYLPDESERKVQHWSEVHHKLIEYLYENDRDKIMECAKNDRCGLSFSKVGEIKGEHKRSLAKNPNITITGGSGKDTKNKIYNIIEECGYGEGDFMVDIKE